ncbi:MAG: recombination regulator RecX [Spirochaetaceae bacterium]|jgi:regulatory protein|nr:recombination regulator RecX [Spirochaetaceae bacterium]
MEGFCTDGQAGPPPALRDALRLVARAEQFSLGLSLKLQKKGYSRDEIRSAVDTLVKTGMLDDQRYARLWVTSRIKRRADSPRELLCSLRGKGIGHGAAVAALKEALSAEVQLALLRRFAKKKGICDTVNGSAAREKLCFDGFSAEALDRFFDE